MARLKAKHQPDEGLERRVQSDLVVSRVQSATGTQTRDISVAKVLEGIRTGGKKLKGQIEQIRNRFEAELAIAGLKAAKEAIVPLKKAVAGVIWTGQYSSREEPVPEKLIQHSGLAVVDLDDLGYDKVPVVRKKIETSQYVFACFLSPSGNGVKVVVRVPADASKHLGSFRAAEKHVKELTGIQIDESGKDVARLCFMSFDPELYHNPDATELEPLPAPEKPKPAFNSSGEVNLSERQRIATEVLGNINWQSHTNGFVQCPGEHLHTAGNGKRDCEIHLDGAPTVHCFHNSCSGIIAGVNHELRSRIGQAEFVPAPEDETITRLAALSQIEYDRIRKDEAKKLKCRESTLDSLVDAKRLLTHPSSDNLQGEAISFPEIEPWHEEVDGAALLDGIAERITHYIWFPAGAVAADASTLWITYTYFYDLFDCAPLLHYSSPEKRSGKTIALEVVGLLVPRPLPVDNVSTAALFRVTAKHHPILLADECDTWLPNNEELRGLFNSGYRRNKKYMRCVGDDQEPRLFDCFTPKALSGIGCLPGTMLDRSIEIRLERAKKGEVQARFDSRSLEIEQELRRKLVRWCNDNRALVEANADPKMPDYIYSRYADNWRPLFAVAEAAGGDWPRRCADACRKLLASEIDDAETLRVMLLTDLQQILTGNWPLPAEGCDPVPLERAFSCTLVECLREMTERPWSEVRRGGKPINERWLAYNLRAFGIKSKSMRIGDENAKGYEAKDFKSAFERYVTGAQSPKPPIPPQNKRHTVTIPMKTEENDPSQTGYVVTDEKEVFDTDKQFEGNHLSEPCDVVTANLPPPKANEDIVMAKKQKIPPLSEYLPEGTSTL